MQYKDTIKNSRLNLFALDWKKEVYPVGHSDGYHYLKMPLLINSLGTGYVQRIEQLEKSIFILTEEKLTLWRKKTPEAYEINVFYDELNKIVNEFYFKED